MNLNLSRSLWLSILVAAGAIIPRSSLAQDAGTTPAPIPEEARKHFVMGETIFKEAKSADNFSQAAAEFAQAVSLAPQFPQARYNLALAKESAGDYAGAMADLKTYQQFKLSDAEARSVQDKIYAVEAKQKMKADKQKADAATAEAKRKVDEPHFEGKWELAGGTYIISKDSSNNYIVDDSWSGANWKTTRVVVSGSNFSFSGTMNNGIFQRLDYDLTLSSDGEKLSGRLSDYYGNTGKTSEFPCEGHRKN